MSENSTKTNKNKVIITVCLMALVLPLSIYLGAFYDPNALDNIILSGDQVLEGDYVVEKGQNVTFKEGIFTFSNSESCVKVYGVFNGIDLTLVGNIEVYDEGVVNINDSPHTVEEIYAFGNSQVTITNSMVHKVYAYDNATVLIDDETFYGTEDYPNVIYGDLLTLIGDLNSTLIALQQDVDGMGDISGSEDYSYEIQALNDTIIFLSENFEDLNGTMLNINTTLTGDINSLVLDLALLEARITALENLNDDDAPYVSIWDLQNGDIIWGEISIQALVWDNSDYTIEVLINGTLSSTILPHIWNTWVDGEGIWNITVRVTDSSSNIAQDQVIINAQKPKAVYRYNVFSTYSQESGWYANNNPDLFGGIAPSSWSDGSATVDSLSSDKEILRTFFTQKGYAGKNALIVAEDWDSYGSTNSRHVVVLFRIYNPTNTAINWETNVSLTCFSSWDEVASAACNGVLVYDSNYANLRATDPHQNISISIPANRVSTVIFGGGSGPVEYDGNMRSLYCAFVNNCLELPAGLEYVDDFDIATGGWES